MTAAEKIRSELSGAKLSAKGKAVAPSVAEALATFCDPTAEARAFVEQYKQYIEKIFRKKARKTA